MESLGLTEIFANIASELLRLQRTEELERDYLIRTYGKRSRYLLTQKELLEFLEYLNTQPTPNVSSQRSFKLGYDEDIYAFKQPTNTIDLVGRTSVEMHRIQWTEELGRDYLIRTYGKRSRHLLTEEEFLDFLSYLESQPTHSSNNLIADHRGSPDCGLVAKVDLEIQRLGWTTQKQREYLLKIYGKYSLYLFTQEQLQDFLNYLKSLPASSD